MTRSNILLVSQMIGANANNQILLKREGELVLMNQIGNIGDTLAHSRNMYRMSTNSLDDFPLRSFSILRVNSKLMLT